MRKIGLILFLFGAYSWAQTPVPSLKETLFEAEEKYKVIFTFDDTLVSGFLGYTKSLPQTWEAFQQLLLDEYGLTSVTSEQAIILSAPAGTKPKTLCGTLTNELSERQFNSVLVVVGNRYAYTDEEGFFSLQWFDETLSQIEFKLETGGTFTLPIASSTDCAAYFIDTSEIQLGEVILNYIAPPIQKNNHGGYDFRVSNFRTSPGSINPDLFELLQLIPGINTPNEDHEVFIRGGTPDQNQLLWNSIRVYQNNHANGNLSSLNPYGIHKIKLYVKGVPSAYGEHTSGLIILDDYKASKQPFFEGSMGLGLIDADLVTRLQLKDRFQLNLSARTSFNTVLTDNFKSIAFNKLIDNKVAYQAFSEQQIQYGDLTLSTRWNLDDKRRLDSYAFFLDDRLAYALTENDLEYKDQLDAQNYGLGIRFTAHQSAWKRLYSLSYSDFELLYDRQLFEYEYDPEDGDYETDFQDLTLRDNHIKEGYFKTQHAKRVNQNWSVVWGLDLVYRDVSLRNESTRNDQTKLTDNQFTGLNGALYGSLKSSFVDKLTLEMGLRYNYFQPIKTSRIEPRINLSRVINDRWSINTTYEKKSQSIYKTNETIQNSSSLSNNLWTAIDGTLYPLLKSSQYSFGATRNYNQFLMDLDFYKRTITGISTFNFGYVDPNDNDFHLGKAEVLGADFLLQKNWERFNLWANYSFQDNQNAFEDLKSGVWFNSNFLVKHLFATGFNLTYKNWVVSTNYTLRSGVPYSKPSDIQWIDGAPQLIYQTLNDAFLPNFERLDASLSKRIELKSGNRLDFKISLKNITNRRNVLERIYLYDKSAAQIRALDRSAMVPFLNVGLRFFY